MNSRPTTGYTREKGNGDGLRRSDLLAVLAVVSIAMVAAAALAGEALSGLLFGKGSLWPQTARGATTQLFALAVGEPDRGLPIAMATRLPAAAWVYATVIVFELAAVIMVMLAVRWIVTWLGPVTADDGFATREQAAAALGARNLTRQRRAEIRPDLYGRRPPRNDGPVGEVPTP